MKREGEEAASQAEKTGKKRDDEYKTVLLMIQVYCKGVHKNRHAMKSPENLCEECKELSDYVRQRIEKCPFMETKTFCSACRVHCYAKEGREQIRKVMRYSGPRMLRYHPVMAIRHLVVTVKSKSRH